jgi:hypothetical protein
MVIPLRPIPGLVDLDDHAIIADGLHVSQLDGMHLDAVTCVCRPI